MRLVVVIYLVLLAVSLRPLKHWAPLWALCQTVQTVFMVLGWMILIPFCVFKLWTRPIYPSINRTKGSHDLWVGGYWNPINWVYGNPEEGVSGQQALIWQGQQQVTYMPAAGPRWRAYCWSALRNSADQTKYWFQFPGPLAKGTWVMGREYKIGWQMENDRSVPVFDL